MSLRRGRLVAAVVTGLAIAWATCLGTAQAPAPVFLRVLSAETGLPLERVTIAPRLANGAARRTDADGWVQTAAADVASGLMAVKPGYVRQYLPTTLASGAEIRMVPGGALTVRAIDPTGHPVAEAHITVRCGIGGFSGPADDRGERRFPGLTPGRCTVNAGPPEATVTLMPSTPPASAPPLPPGISLGPSAGAPAGRSGTAAVPPPVRLPSTPTSAARGTPTPISNPVRSEELMRQRTASLNQALRSDADTVTVDIVRGGEVHVAATVRRTESTTTPAAVVPIDGGVIRGTVTGPDGRPVAGVLVAAIPPGTGFELSPRFQTRTDDTGAYAIPTPPDSYRVSVRCPCRGLISPDVTDAIRIEAGGTYTEDVVLGRASVISGRVLNEYGEPEEDAQVTIYDAAVVSGLPVAGTRTDDRGMYRVARLRASVYRVGIRPRTAILTTRCSSSAPPPTSSSAAWCA